MTYYEFLAYESGKFKSSEILNKDKHFSNSVARGKVDAERNYIIPNLVPGKYDIYLIKTASNKAPALTGHFFQAINVNAGEVIELN